MLRKIAEYIIRKVFYSFTKFGELNSVLNGHDSGLYNYQFGLRYWKY